MVAGAMWTQVHVALAQPLIPSRCSMDFADRLTQLAARIPRQLDHVETEEATKNALIMPFIQALGYDVFDPTVVVPEYTADVGTKRGEKVDYMILRDGRPAILIECKAAGGRLDIEQSSQLYRYFSVTEARVGVLTDGVRYRFFSDLEEPNRMDSRPFLEFSMLELGDGVAGELKRFTRESFDIERIISTASDLKYRRGIKKILAEEWTNPSEDLVRLLAGRVYSGRMTQGVREQFTALVKDAFHEFLSERVTQRLKSALERDGGEDEREAEEEAEDAADLDSGNGIVTTEDEIEGYMVVRAILAETIDPKRVFMRDRKNYCGILLDDTNRRPICRLWFNTSQKYLGLFDAEKNEERVPIDGVPAIYQHAVRLRETVARYEGVAAGPEAGPSPSY